MTAEPAREWYTGTAYGSFDGTVTALGIENGRAERFKLVLTGSDKELDCHCSATPGETLLASLNKRVRVYGWNTYDGTRGLPVRIDVTKIEPVEVGGDFTRWRGSFKPFAIADWDGDWCDEVD